MIAVFCVVTVRFQFCFQARHVLTGCRIVRELRAVFGATIFCVLVVRASAVSCLRAGHTARHRVRIRIFVAGDVIPSHVPFEGAIAGGVLVFKDVDGVFVIRRLAVPIFMSPAAFAIRVCCFGTVGVASTFACLCSIEVNCLAKMFRYAHVGVIVVQLGSTTERAS